MKTLIQNLTDRGGNKLDLLLEGGLIAASLEAGSMHEREGAEVIDAAGYFLLPPLVDAHAHLDKTVLGMDWFKNDIGPRLVDRIDNERVSRKKIGLDARVQAGRLIELAMSQGTLYMRSHVDVDTVNGLSCLEGVMEAREEYRDRFGIE
ncbi:MAG: cytosine deaminase, partial [Clostridia bacterium]|nr:cytosine deaminase [Clostridia bacterium]